MDIPDVIRSARGIIDANPLVGLALLAAVGAALLVHHKPRTRFLLPVSAVARLVGAYVAWVAAIEIGRSMFPGEWIDIAGPWAALLLFGVAIWLILQPRREVVIVEQMQRGAPAPPAPDQGW